MHEHMRLIVLVILLDIGSRRKKQTLPTSLSNTTFFFFFSKTEHALYSDAFLSTTCPHRSQTRGSWLSYIIMQVPNHYGYDLTQATVFLNANV